AAAHFMSAWQALNCVPHGVMAQVPHSVLFTLHAAAPPDPPEPLVALAGAVHESGKHAPAPVAFDDVTPLAALLPSVVLLPPHALPTSAAVAVASAAQPK